MLKKIILPAFLVALTVVGNAQAQKSKSYELASPGGINKIKFKLEKTAPKYEVSHGKTQVITPSDMGFLLKNNDDFSTNFEVVDVKNTSFDETWEQVWGEKKKIRNHYNQMVVILQQKNASKNANWKFSSVLMMTELLLDMCIQNKERKTVFLSWMKKRLSI